MDTIRRNGGASYSLTYGDMAGRDGYAVSCYKPRERSVMALDLDATEVQDYILENSDLLAEKENFLGVWLNKGMYILDVTTFEKSKVKAIALAKANDQEAIFKLDTLETLYV